MRQYLQHVCTLLVDKKGSRVPSKVTLMRRLDAECSVEIVAVTGVDKKDISRAYKAIGKAIDLGGLGQVSASEYMVCRVGVDLIIHPLLESLLFSAQATKEGTTSGSACVRCCW